MAAADSCGLDPPQSTKEPSRLLLRSWAYFCDTYHILFCEVDNTILGGGFSRNL